MIDTLDVAPSSIHMRVNVHVSPGRFATRADEPKVSKELVSTDLGLPDPGRLGASLRHRREVG